jgi:hypothetical protein
MAVETETTTYLLTQFESIGDELRKLRERDLDATRQIKDLEKKLSHAEQHVRRLREKVSVLEKQPVVLDGEDERWLMENRATIEFSRNVDGNRKVVVRSRGRQLALVTDRPEKPKSDMLRQALNEASDRKRK